MCFINKLRDFSRARVPKEARRFGMSPSYKAFQAWQLIWSCHKRRHVLLFRTPLVKFERAIDSFFKSLSMSYWCFWLIFLSLAHYVGHKFVVFFHPPAHMMLSSAKLFCFTNDWKRTTLPMFVPSSLLSLFVGCTRFSGDKASKLCSFRQCISGKNHKQNHWHIHRPHAFDSGS